MGDQKDAQKNTESVDSKQNGDGIDLIHGNLLYAGMIGVDLIVLQVFIPLGVHDISSFVSVLAFAVGLPLLATSVYIFNDPKIERKRLIGTPTPSFWGISVFVLKGYFILFCLIIGFLASIIGLSAAFWHISWIVGIPHSQAHLRLFMGPTQHDRRYY